RRNPSEEGLPSPPPRTPPPHPPKTFLFIESLFAAFPVDEGTALRMERKGPSGVAVAGKREWAFSFHQETHSKEYHKSRH
ncbi:MAG: hypothetical protein KHX83_15710, partial [Bilophila sp.]|nr:hypothetical protein [Bilophila sp.]